MTVAQTLEGQLPGRHMDLGSEIGPIGKPYFGIDSGLPNQQTSSPSL